MQVWVALLRAVNVGGRRKVPMAGLRALCEDLGWSSVRTYIASGNVVLAAPERSADAVAERLSTAVAARFGFPVPVMVRSPGGLRRLVDDVPPPDAEHLNVGFLSRQPLAEQVRVWQAGLINGASIVVAGADVYLRVPSGLGAPFLSGPAAKDFGGLATVRNWRTVTALSRLADDVAGAA